MVCSKCYQAGIVIYNACRCEQDTNDYKRSLDEQLDWLTVDHDDLRQDISDQISTPKYHPSMAVIDKWEQETIAHIRSIAILARRTLINALDQHIFEVKKTLDTLTPKIRKARQYIKSFNETDIQQWANILHELKKMPMLPVTVDKNNNIYGITIYLERQYRSLDSIIHNPTSSKFMSNETSYQSRNAHITEKINGDNETAKAVSVSSHPSWSITPGGVLIIREQQNDETDTLRIQQALKKLPLNPTTH